jgi:6-pyruvoyltetrahydropterin/6-carboxytetrahydropterin synthase
VPQLVDCMNSQPMSDYRVRVSSDDLVFSAAHFITWDARQCERLHGHNYRVAAEQAGALNSSGFVIDFGVLREALRAVLAELDHRVLLPGEHPSIHVSSGQQEIEVRFRERRWIFPKDDCLVLPIANTTAELLADYIGRRLLAALAAGTDCQPQWLRIEVEESMGRRAVCEIQKDP